MVTWVEEIIDKMEKLGGHAKYEDLYKEFEKQSRKDIHSVKDYKAQIRGAIEAHSSDSDVFSKKTKKDLFYSVEGKGKGHWGLRKFTITENNVDLTADDTGFLEGKKSLRLHTVRERNPKVIKKAKEKFKEKHGSLYCEACNFDFVKTYGALGEDFIEGHHLKPVAQLQENEITKIDDIALLCSNCHSMIHRYKPWISNKKDLSKILLKKDI